MAKRGRKKGLKVVKKVKKAKIASAILTSPFTAGLDNQTGKA